MASLTASGVCYDMSNTPFFVSRNGHTWYFSSDKHSTDFAKKVQAHEDWLCDSLSRRFHVSVDARLLADFQLYDRIEKRGFRLVDAEGKEWRQSADMVFNGMRISGVCSKMPSVGTTELLIG